MWERGSGDPYICVRFDGSSLLRSIFVFLFWHRRFNIDMIVGWTKIRRSRWYITEVIKTWAYDIFSVIMVESVQYNYGLRTKVCYRCQCYNIPLPSFEKYQVCTKIAGKYIQYDIDPYIFLQHTRHDQTTAPVADITLKWKYYIENGRRKTLEFSEFDNFYNSTTVRLSFSMYCFTNDTWENVVENYFNSSTYVTLEYY